jgi:L-alanine-DL-glutamate epimerase-like enolase superfamily enzyme
MPFRFGVATMTEGIEAFLHVRVTREDGREAWGIAAEQLAAWFDKNLALTHEDNFVQLRTSLSIARDLYTSERRPRSAFARFAECYRAQIEACAVRDLNPLIAGYGPALLDRAVLDALCRLHGVSFYEAIRANLPGIAPVELLPEFRGVDVDAFLATLTPADWIDARHTVGMVDPITSADQTGAARVGDGLPETLEEVVTTYRHRYYKLKLGGDVTRDLARLAAIAVVLDGIAEPYRVTLDGNEQYEDVDGITELWNALEQTPALRRMVDSILFIEQPIARQRALERDVARLSARRPVIIDESDADLDAFPRARERGYLGVSSKTCKGLYKSLINRARCALWNRKLGGDRYFMSAEDLTTQPGVSVQQDLALVSLLGLTHVERNGHHYVNGMAAVPAAEQQRFLDAHPDLYTRSHGAVRLRIEGGRLAIGSLACPGFAVGAEPDWASMRETSRTVPPFPPTTTR